MTLFLYKDGHVSPVATICLDYSKKLPCGILGILTMLNQREEDRRRIIWKGDDEGYTFHLKAYETFLSSRFVQIKSNCKFANHVEEVQVARETAWS